jgi:F-type H+-transporting ATPase subunit gamma
MSRAVELRARIASIDELLGVVTATRSLAAARVTRAERALPGIRRYAEIVGDAIARARMLVTSPGPVLGGDEAAPARLIVTCSEHGFAGAFNERLLDRAAVELEAHGGRLWIVGTRGSTLARTRGLAVEWEMAMATHVAGVFETARGLAAELERRIASGTLGQLAILGAHRGEGEAALIARMPLLPFEAVPPHQPLPSLPPLHALAPDRLLGQVIAEYIVGELTRALMESFASENAARLQAMEAARHNIDDKLRALREEARRLRQEEITAELLDVITGAEAVAPRRT